MMFKYHTKAVAPRARRCGSARHHATAAMGRVLASLGSVRGTGLAQVDWGRCGAVALTMLVVAAGAAGPARAASTTTDDRAAVPTGAASPIDGRGFSIEGTIRTLYDNNILRSGNGQATLPGYYRSDFRISPSVTVAAGLPVGRQQLFIGANVGRDFYVRNTRLDRNRYDISGGAILRAGNSCSGSLTAEYKRRQSFVTEASVRTDNTQEIQDYGAIVDCAPTSGIGFGGGVTRSVTNNQNGLRTGFNSTNMDYDAHLNLSSPTLGQFSAGGSYSRISYPTRLLIRADDGAQVGDHLEILAGHVGYAKVFGPRLTINVSGSYQHVKPVPADVLNIVILPIIGPVGIPSTRQTYSGPGFSLLADYHPGTRLSASLGASRNVTSSPNVGAQFVVRDNIDGDVTYKLGPSITTSAGANYSHNRYRGSFASAVEPVARNADSITRFYARATYQPRRLYGVDFEIAHQIRKSNPSLYNFSSTTAAVTLRVKFGRG